MLDLGVITPEEARTHRDKHVIVQNLGIFPEEMTIEPYISQAIDIQSGDVFLLCSDGLSDMVSDEQIASIAGMYGSARAIAQYLVNAALENGGYDNVTVIAVIAEKRR
jgi:protein phosphatase